MNTNKKYVMIVTSEDERYGRDGIQLDFFWDNPWEGILEDIVFGDSYKELTCNGKYEGLFQQTYDIKTGTRLSYGGIDDLTPKEEIEEWENKNMIKNLKILRDGQYMLGRIKDVAAEIFHTNNNEIQFDDIDFALYDEQNLDLSKEIDLTEIKANDSGWYGIKQIVTGFNEYATETIEVFADYYGAGCGVYHRIDIYNSYEENVSIVKQMMIDTLSYQEGTVTDDMFIICEFQN